LVWQRGKTTKRRGEEIEEAKKYNSEVLGFGLVSKQEGLGRNYLLLFFETTRTADRHTHSKVIS
jgi:hypothetical protein